MSERFLVTGAYGCIGAWVVRQLVEEAVPVVAFDLGDDPRRIRQVLGEDRIDAVTLAAGNVTDLELIERTLDEHGITRIVHLAALQIPFCRADPPTGARVNVVGTVNVFEAAPRRLETVPGVVYASSIASLDDPDGGPLRVRRAVGRTPCTASSSSPTRAARGSTRRSAVWPASACALTRCTGSVATRG